jgi:hypothetical protein
MPIDYNKIKAYLCTFVDKKQNKTKNLKEKIIKK